jgi:excinuclease ABC A subunit
MVVITGLSGSGKSSLAFDTIYAEGQRRYIESLSSYARMFLGQLEKPDLDSIEGLSPAISIDQKSTVSNPRSTVGTVTEIYDYLRLLYARVGEPYCPSCGKPIRTQTIDQIIDKLKEYAEGTRMIIYAPMVRGKKGEFSKLFESFRRSGYARVKVDGIMYELDEEIKLNKNNSEADQQHVVGKMSLLITDQVPFKREVSQTIKPEPYIPFPNGNYRLSFKLKNQGKLSNVKVLVKTGGKTITHNCPTQEIDWHSETFNVKVSGNQATIIFHVEGEAQAECRIDDVEMIAI